MKVNISKHCRYVLVNLTPRKHLYATFYKFFKTSHSLRAAKFWFWFELELVVKWFSSPLLPPKHVFSLAHNHFKNFLEAVEMNFRLENCKRRPLDCWSGWQISLPAQCDQPSQIQLRMNKVFSTVISIINIVWTINKNSEFSFCFQIFVAKFGSRKLPNCLIFDIASIYFILILKVLFIF